MDRALNRMVIDVERLSKAQVPHNKGQLKSSGHHERKGFLLYRIVFNKVYALYQEFGGDGKGRVVKKYSKPGKKKFYLRDPGRLIASKAMSYFRNEAMV
jgi:hypothetical protein